MTSLRRTFDLVRAAFQQFQRDHGARLAASLAFYSAISIAPLLATLVGLVGAVVGPRQAEQRLLEQVNALVGPQVTEFVRLVVEGTRLQQPAATTSVGARLVQVLIVLWGSANVFLELRDSLNLIWNVQPQQGKPVRQMLGKRLLGFGLVLAFGFLIVVSLAFSAGVSLLLQRAGWLQPSAAWLLPLVNLWLTLFGSAVLFALLYRGVPDADVSWRVAWLGGMVTGVLFALGTFALKALLAGKGAPYGVTGSLIVFLLWVYYSAQIVFFGAELTQVYSERIAAEAAGTPGPTPGRRGQAGAPETAGRRDAAGPPGNE
jgi:membrane protein